MPIQGGMLMTTTNKTEFILLDLAKTKSWKNDQGLTSCR